MNEEEEKRTKIFDALSKYKHFVENKAILMDDVVYRLSPLGTILWANHLYHRKDARLHGKHYSYDSYNRDLYNRHQGRAWLWSDYASREVWYGNEVLPLLGFESTPIEKSKGKKLPFFKGEQKEALYSIDGFVFPLVLKESGKGGVPRIVFRCPCGRESAPSRMKQHKCKVDLEFSLILDLYFELLTSPDVVMDYHNRESIVFAETENTIRGGVIYQKIKEATKIIIRYQYTKPSFWDWVPGARKSENSGTLMRFESGIEPLPDPIRR